MHSSGFKVLVSFRGETDGINIKRIFYFYIHQPHQKALIIMSRCSDLSQDGLRFLEKIKKTAEQMEYV